MINLENSKLFEKFIDPVTGVTSYLLVKKPSFITQSFYFTNNSLSPDGRYLWFYCAFPPSGSANYGRFLGRIDFEEDDVSWFPETMFSDASPAIHPVTGEAYWCTHKGIFARGPKKDDKVKTISVFPEWFIKNRVPYRVATHLTFSSDLKAVNIDAQVGREWIIGEISLETGELTVWKKMDICYNHSQCCPTDRDLHLIAQDWWHDCVTGEMIHYQNRVWTIRKNEDPQPLFEGIHKDMTHEWWSKDGKGIWYVDYDRGTCRYDLATKESICAWDRITCHSNCNTDEKYLVADINTYDIEKDKPFEVVFYNTLTKKETAIVSDMTKLVGIKKHYHLHPHPMFIDNDEFIMYTFNDEESTTLALTPMSELI